MKNYKRFNRHDSMSNIVKQQIDQVLHTDLWSEEITRNMRKSVENALYGLYDGFLYNSLLKKAMDLPDPVKTKIVDIWLVCNTYPESKTQVF